jgi:hypothetical protein
MSQPASSRKCTFFQFSAEEYSAPLLAGTVSLWTRGRWTNDSLATLITPHLERCRGTRVVFVVASSAGSQRQLVQRNVEGLHEDAPTEVDIPWLCERMCDVAAALGLELALVHFSGPLMLEDAHDAGWIADCPADVNMSGWFNRSVPRNLEMAMLQRVRNGAKPRTAFACMNEDVMEDAGISHFSSAISPRRHPQRPVEIEPYAQAQARSNTYRRLIDECETDVEVMEVM